MSQYFRKNKIYIIFYNTNICLLFKKKLNILNTKFRKKIEYPTYDICICLPAWHPLASLKPPVIWVSKYYIHKYIIMSSWVKARNVEA